MAVVYPTIDDPASQPGTAGHVGFVQEAERHPIWTMVLLGILAVAGYAVLSRLRGTSPGAASPPGAASQPTVEYVPTANYFTTVGTIDNGPGGQPPPTPNPNPGPPPPPNPGPPPPNPGPPPPNPGPGPGYNGVPLIPFGQYTGPSYSAGQFHFGETYGYNGTNYELGPGSNGALWGVPLSAGEQPLSQQQWNNTPIAPGGKVLLYGPQSAYGAAKGGGPPVVWLRDYVRRKPVAV